MGPRLSIPGGMDGSFAEPTGDGAKERDRERVREWVAKRGRRSQGRGGGREGKSKRGTEMRGGRGG